MAAETNRLWWTGVLFTLGLFSWAAGIAIQKQASGRHQAPPSPGDASPVDPRLPVRPVDAAGSVLAGGPTDQPVDADIAQYFPRAESAWQGMPVDMNLRQECSTTAECSDWLVCWSDGRCGPCGDDQPCLSGETCVLDHCVADGAYACGDNSDCRDDEVCILERAGSGSTRADGFVRSICVGPGGGEEPRTEPSEAPPARFVEGDWVHPEELLAGLRQAG